MNETYICKKCSKVTDRDELNSKGWLICKVCLCKYQKSYREANKDRLSILNKEYRTANKVEISAQRSNYRKNNGSEIAIRNKKSWAKNGKKYSANHYKWKVNKLKTDTQFRLRETIRSRITMAIKGKVKTGSAIKLLGCSMQEFRSHIENQFKPGMTWNNWSLKGWHLDHIKPIKQFDLTDPAQLAEVCHYSNMRPLWAAENLERRFKKC